MPPTTSLTGCSTWQRHFLSSSSSSSSSSSWKKEVFGNVFSLVKQANNAASEAERNFDRNPTDEDLINLKKAKRCFDSCPIFRIRIFEAKKDFFGGTPMPRSLTATTITLIPKIDSPQTWSDFRPISLCNVTNKILSKTSIQQMAALLPSLISPSQSGFVPGKLIEDNIFLVQELTHSIDQRYSKGNGIIKLDMSKAYDRVCWKFLYSIMLKMDFPHRIMNLTKHAVENYWFTVLVNGDIVGFFKSTQGFRQCDPLSHTLFILVAEALSRGLDDLFQEHNDMYYQTNHDFPIFHLSYADDIIIITNSEEARLFKLIQFLEHYEATSGQKINYSKSSFVPRKKLTSSFIELKTSLDSP
ncbi:UNVERIFIED_CONTAM: hypothetical protein Sradi_5418700 [Sesamum radiatum]|uniref:Reverse transcriptase domain-containing protein n=1 Tax=Sesamum radiatum TaxID=300843 RepID=A0AAW2L7W2_SESRA